MEKAIGHSGVGKETVVAEDQHKTGQSGAFCSHFVLWGILGFNQ